MTSPPQHAPARHSPPCGPPATHALPHAAGHTHTARPTAPPPNPPPPAQLALHLDPNNPVDLTGNVPVNRPATMVLPAGGGQINGRVYMELPTGMRLPIHMTLPVPVDQQLPVEMDVPVAIPLRETDLGGVIQQLRDLLAPLHLAELEEILECRR